MRRPLLMHRPGKGKLLLTQHPGRAAVRRENCLLPDHMHRPEQRNQLLTQHPGRAASRRKTASCPITCTGPRKENSCHRMKQNESRAFREEISYDKTGCL